MRKIPMLEKFAAQSLIEHDGELIFSKEKFAELIVKECVGILEPKSRYMGEGPEVLKDKIRQIKQHFGVEE